MDRKLARRNMVLGSLMFAALCLLMGMAFAWALLYNAFV